MLVGQFTKGHARKVYPYFRCGASNLRFSNIAIRKVFDMILMTVLKLRWFRIKYSKDNWQTHTGETTRGIVFPPQEGDRR